jgi:sigma-B regulation protein RsbU (phosphoserine phosphatase)
VGPLISPSPSFAAGAGDWRQRTALIVQTLREMSQQTDPQAMVRAYSSRLQKVTAYDRTVSLSRRDLIAPWYRITRSTLWKEPLDPWKDADRLPMFDRGLLGELIYANEPRIIEDLAVDEDDPAYEYFEGMRSLIALPHFDGGESLNMVVHMRREAGAFDPEELPQVVWISGLFGRATQNLVLSKQVSEAYAAVDRELQVVADIQRSLLPAQLPSIPNLSLAAHYQTSRYAGGDYYDFFELPQGKWGILIADVSGHGTPAAVIMAILHSIAHAVPGEAQAPAKMLDFVNQRLTKTYTGGRGTFVTAFYGVYDPAARTLTYSCAGHNPPRLKRCADGSVTALDRDRGLPLGILDDDDGDEGYKQSIVALGAGDILLFYTDGITEAWSAEVGPDGREVFGLARLDAILDRCLIDADATVREILMELDAFTGGKPATDDRTLLAAQVE